MHYKKPALSFEDQVRKLKVRGLHIPDENSARHSLSRISYYRLRAYTYPFQDNSSPNQPFIEDIDFETIIALYKFDRKLRMLIFDAIEKIEVALRTQIIYHFAMAYGSHWQMDPSLFRDTGRFVKHLATLNKEVNRSDETFIKHYKEKYTKPSQPPSWMSMEVASMGSLSKFYQNLKISEEKEAVAYNFSLPNVKIMESWMFCFSYLRNICAHHGRLWNRRLTAKPILPYNTKATFITKQESKTLYKNKIYATLCCVVYMLDQIETGHGFRESLIALMITCPKNQEQDMNFPKNWQAHPLWHLSPNK